MTADVLLKMNQILNIASILLALLPHLTQASTMTERAEWAKFFDQFSSEGTIVILDERAPSQGLMVFNIDRANKQFSPASTFKIPHALFALDSEVIRDEFETITWDGKKRFHPPWNRDQNLRSSMRHSVVWVYERFAEAIGEKKEQEYLEKIQYGNQTAKGKNPFWLKGGNLRISAREQVEFLKRLYRNELPFDIGDQRLVKDVILIEAERDWILRGKSGWDGKIGWWVGWVEHPNGTVFFALNIDTPNGLDDLPKRESITRTVLASIGALKQDAEQGSGGNG